MAALLVWLWADSYPVAIYLFGGKRRLDTRINLAEPGVMRRGEAKGKIACLNQSLYLIFSAHKTRE